MFAWLMKTPLAIQTIEKWSHGYLEMDCDGGRCYGVLAVRMKLRNLASHVNVHCLDS